MLLRILLLLCLCGYTAVAQPLPALIPYSDGTKWGYADTTGRVVISPRWDEARFFAGDKAVVVLYREEGKPQSAVSCIIDRAGRYIVPPAAGWTGDWHGWAASGLNAVDSLGRWGMIDTAGNVLISYAWEGGGYPVHSSLRDSFKIVRMDGMFGLIDRSGKLVAPCRWGSIAASDEFAVIGAFLVQDPDNIGGLNSHGVVDAQGRILLPPRYNGINLLTLPDGSRAFRVSIAESNEPQRYGQPGSFVKWLAYPTGKEIPDPNITITATAQQTEFAEPGGYISFGSHWGRGLKDSAGHVMIPCCKLWKVTADTIFLREEAQSGKDSTIVTLTYLDARTQKLLHSRILYLYREEPRALFSTSMHGGYPYDYREPLKIQVPDYGAVDKFYKDSMLYSVQAAATANHNRQLFIVVGQPDENGEERHNRYSYYAVLDSNLNYVVPPLRNYRILAYNPEERIVVAQGYSERLKREGYALLSQDGEELMQPQNVELLDGFRWRGKVYAYAVEKKTEYESGPYTSHSGPNYHTYIAAAYVLDTSGTPLPALSSYRVITSPVGPRAAQVYVLDSANRIGILTPGGEPVHPKLNFKYTRLTPAGAGWFLVTSGRSNVVKLVDAANRQIPGGVNVRELYPVATAQNPFTRNVDQNLILPRLYRATGVEESTGRSISFYLDDRGRAYYAGAR